MTGPLEETNSPYAVAKIAGVEMCWAYNRQYGCRFIPVMPANLCGDNDTLDLENSHVLPALNRKYHLAKMAAAGDLAAINRDKQRFGPIPAGIRAANCLSADSTSLSSEAVKAKAVVWGTGTPKREFLYVDDMADACAYILSLPEAEFVSRLAGQEKPLVNIGTGFDCTIAELAQLDKEVVALTASKPDGTPRKLLDVTRVTQLGWQARIDHKDGIEQVFRWYGGEVC